MHRYLKVSIGIILAFQIPSILFAEDLIKTGYDLYENIKLNDNLQTPKQLVTLSYTSGYIAGYLEGLSLMQDFLYNATFPPKMMSDQERGKYAKQLNFNRLNIPEAGLVTGQLMLIFKKYAEKHPEELNDTANVCLFNAIAEAYGWK